MRALLAAVALPLACTAPPEPAPKPEPRAPVVDEFRELKPDQRPRRTGGGAPRAKGSDLSERWLIILDSEGDMAKRTDRLSKLAKLDVKKEPLTLSSTEFKGLMPCFDVLIASHFADRKEAIAYSKKLTAAGVGNYPKNAGKYVGKQPAVEAYCAQGRASSSCGGGLYLAVSHADRTFVDIGLGEIEAARALEAAPKPRSIEGPGVWEQPLAAIKLGALKQGDALTVQGGAGKAARCKVKGFSALTRGTPHFSATDAGKPACGEPRVFAELDCSVNGAAVAWSAGAKVEVARRVDLKTGQEPFPVDERLLAGAKAARADGEAHAKEQGAPLAEESFDQRWSVGGKVYRHGHVRLKTGAGFAECGGPDFRRHLDGWSVDDRVLSPLSEGHGRGTRAVLLVDGEPLEVYSELFGDRAVRSLTGDDRCRLPLPFCDCGC
jgi:hypothetical protein